MIALKELADMNKPKEESESKTDDTMLLDSKKSTSDGQATPGPGMNAR